MIDYHKLREGMPARIRSDIEPGAMERWDPGIRLATDEETDTPTITIMDVIGYDFWTGEGVTDKRIAAALRSIGPKSPVDVLINSPGGDMWTGISIHNLLDQHRGHVTIKVLGLAASAASIIAMAGDTVEIAKAGFFMIHNPWVVGVGDSNDFEALAAHLKPFDAAMADVYADRANLDHGEIRKMMDAETYIGSSKAIEQGFADAILTAETEESEDSDDEVNKMAAVRKIDHALAQVPGMTRRQRRELLTAYKASMSGAAGDQDTRDAVPDLSEAVALCNRMLEDL